jgi:hypothetical protein
MVLPRVASLDEQDGEPVSKTVDAARGALRDSFCTYEARTASVAFFWLGNNQYKSEALGV